MVPIQFDPISFVECERRQMIFDGQIFLDSARPGSKALCDLAHTMLSEAFSGTDPQKAQFSLPVEDFVTLIGPTKSRFTNSPRTKELVQTLLADYGCDLSKTYFDVPRLRAATSHNYLTAGVGYAYKPHRDTWYSSPHSQLNWWIPVHDLVVERALAFYPTYWNRAIRNLSSQFDYQEWCLVGRQQATSQIKTDTRKHPLPEEPISPEDELRLVCQAASVICFSAAHLHGTAPNNSDLTRFSIDFRTVHLDDLLSDNGAPNIDCEATGTTLGDFISASDFTPIPQEIVMRQTKQKNG